MDLAEPIDISEQMDYTNYWTEDKIELMKLEMELATDSCQKSSLLELEKLNSVEDVDDTNYLYQSQEDNFKILLEEEKFKKLLTEYLVSNLEISEKYIDFSKVEFFETMWTTEAKYTFSYEKHEILYDVIKNTFLPCIHFRACDGFECAFFQCPNDFYDKTKITDIYDKENYIKRQTLEKL
jgi:hypothetical protein